MMKKLKGAILDLIFPRRCIGCRQIGSWLCEQCFSLIELNEAQTCYICRRPSAQGKTCLKHFENSRNPQRLLDHLLVACHYSANPILKQAIFALKYKKRKDIAKKLGKILSGCLYTSFSGEECSILKRGLSELRSNGGGRVPQQKIGHLSPENILPTPIPLHKKRHKKRGFNQSELLAQYIKIGSRPSTIDSQLLTRHRHTPPQTQCKSRHERLNNLKNAFKINGRIDPHKTYLLIDDITTTGTTLEECCQLLKKHGTKEVWGLVLARN